MTFEELRTRNLEFWHVQDEERAGRLPFGLSLARSWGRWIVRRHGRETWTRHPDGSLTIDTGTVQ